ncbi:MAG: hypothetical protein H6851_05140 [Geminicoccaceae bacterium]|nr:hypothetical protein [Geminicoccaceae bacterium]
MSLKIPVYQRQQSAAGPVDIRGPKAAATGLDALGAAVQTAGDEMHRVALEQKRRQEEAEDRANQAWANEGYGNLLIADADLEAEARQNAAPGAVGYTDARLKSFDEQAAELLARAPSEKARQFLSARLQTERISQARRGLDFEADSRAKQQRHGVDQLTAGLSAKVFADPSSFEDAMGALTEGVAGMGLGQATAPVLEEQRAVLAESYARAMVEREPGRIRGELMGDEAWTRYLSPAMRHSLANSADAEVESRRREDEARVEKARIRSGRDAGDLIYTPGASLGDMLAEARSSIGDQSRRESAVEQIKLRYSEREAARRDAEEQASRSAWDIVNDGGSLDDLPEPVLAGLSADSRHAIEQYDRIRADGKKPETDWQTYHELMGKSLADLERVNLMNYRPLLADTEFKQLQARQQGIRDGRETDAPDEPGTLAQQIATTVTTLELKDADKGRLQAGIRREIDRQQKQLKRELSWSERQNILDSMTVEVVTEPGRFMDTEGTPAFLTPAETAAHIGALAKTFGLPADDIAAIRDALIMTGQPLTEANFKRMIEAGRRAR